MGFFILAVVSSMGACSSMEAEKPVMESENEEETKTSEPISQDMNKDEKEDSDKEDDTKQPETEQPEPAQSGEAVTANVTSPLLQKGETVSYTFPNAGVNNIYCEPHPVMKMKVIVQADAMSEKNLALDIAGYEFSEMEITVAPGTTITWTNQDFAEHNVAIVVE